MTGGAEPHSPGCSPSVTNKTEGLADETELNLGKLKMGAKNKAWKETIVNGSKACI